MPSVKEIRDILLFAHSDNLINDEEYLMLYDLNKSSNLELPYWNYDRFDPHLLTDDECKSEFRFYKNVYLLAEVLRVLDEIRCYSRVVVDGIEALCIFLKRIAYPCRYSYMLPRFARPVPQLCMISNQMMDFIYQTHNHRLRSLNQQWLSQASLQNYADIIHAKGAALQNCWSFIDETVRPVSRPGKNQRALYNWHKRVHAIKFQSIVSPNGLIANLYGPVEGRRHDSGMLAESGLLGDLQRNPFSPLGQPLCVYGDPAYPLNIHLQGPFEGARTTPLQNEYNTTMSSVRTSVEWVFGDIVNYFAFMDFKKNVKVRLCAVGKMCMVCALLTNARTCLYLSVTSSYFGLDPPTFEKYFPWKREIRKHFELCPNSFCLSLVHLRTVTKNRTNDSED